MSFRKIVPLLLCLLFLAAYVAQGLAFIHANSQTFDEAAHLACGYSFLARRDFRLIPEHPPLLREWAALLGYCRGIAFEPDPATWEWAQRDHLQVWRIGRDFLTSSSVSAEQLLTMGRLPMLAIGAALVALIGWWSYRLWGSGAAVLGMGLAAFEPNLIAHGSLVTTDLGVAFFMFLTLYLLWEYEKSPSLWWLVAVGISTGLALSAKHSAVLLLVLVPLLQLYPKSGERAAAHLGQRLRRAVLITAVMIALAGVVIWLAYAMQGLSTWFAGLHKVLSHQAEGHEAYCMGDYSDQGWWYYFPLAFSMKTPLGTLLALGVSLLLLRAGKPLGRAGVVYLLLPAALVLAVAMRARINIGIRHVLVLYPFALMLAARLATFRFQRAWLAPALAGLFLVMTLASSLRAAPHQLAYFNELIGGPDRGYLYLADSNLDWGQDLKGLKAYVDEQGVPMIYLSYFGTAQPETYGIRCQRVPPVHFPKSPPTELLPADTSPELLAISVNHLLDIYSKDKQTFAWLRGRSPIAKMGYSIVVFDLTNDAAAHFALAKVYIDARMPKHAAAELRRVLKLDPAHQEAAALLRPLGMKLRHLKNPV